jgi:chitodextrinase
MVHSRWNSRSTAPVSTTPIPTPTFPAESFIRRVSTLRRGDVRALAASSIAVASSIGSPSLSDDYLPYPDKHGAAHTSRRDHGAIGQESNSHRVPDLVWQTAYSTARMAVDITKESSDTLLPLKAVVGAISILIKNYDVSPIPVTVELLC